MHWWGSTAKGSALIEHEHTQTKYDTMKATTLTRATVGSISHGTLRPEDVLEALGNELEWQIRRNGDYYSSPENFGERDRLNNLVGEYMDSFGDDGESLTPEGEENASELIGDLSDALSMFAPPYCYFGTHEGDGSDFGYWPSSMEIDDLPTVEGSDEAEELGEDCKSVNDHGNVTVYGGDGSVLLELV